EVVKRAADALHGITESAEKVAVIVADIARASREQSEGIDQISQAVSQVDQVTQKNASAAEETASASEELSAQAETLRKTVEDLERLVGFTGAKTEQAVPA
ncbi:MAG: methyl-accepting chemotaxis protein, partial [candidate division Zixibacteria bacterium]|nr:methyl-accepting chemotaxis protein [candidate division Zixibacteria bacterium]